MWAIMEGRGLWRVRAGLMGPGRPRNSNSNSFVNVMLRRVPLKLLKTSRATKQPMHEASAAAQGREDVGGLP